MSVDVPRCAGIEHDQPGERISRRVCRWPHFPIDPEPRHVSQSGLSCRRALLDIRNGGDRWTVSAIDRTAGRGDMGGNEAVDRDGLDGESELCGAGGGGNCAEEKHSRWW